MKKVEVASPAKQRAEAVAKRNNDVMRAGQAAVHTLQGESLIALLELRFGGMDAFVPGDPYHTHVKVGEKRVLDFLRNLREGETT